MTDPAELLKQALALPPEARAALAASLLESIDDHVDERAEAAWRGEIERRLAQIDSGVVRLVPWDEARQALRARLSR